jgi:hypothetical protein
MFSYLQRKVDLRRHKETQHTDLRALPHPQAPVRPATSSQSMAAHPGHSHPPPSLFMSALHRAHFLPPPGLPGMPLLPLPTSLAFSSAAAQHLNHRPALN